MKLVRITPKVPDEQKILPCFFPEGDRQGLTPLLPDLASIRGNIDGRNMTLAVGSDDSAHTLTLDCLWRGSLIYRRKRKSSPRAIQPASIASRSVRPDGFAFDGADPTRATPSTCQMSSRRRSSRNGST